MRRIDSRQCDLWGDTTAASEAPQDALQSILTTRGVCSYHFSIKTPPTGVYGLWTDGGCCPNPGRGAWAVVDSSGVEVGSGIEEHTTNNRMELQAFLFAATIAKDKLAAHIHTDSEYVANGFNSWMLKWHKKNWRKVKNDDLWRLLYDARATGNIKAVIVRGHADDKLNNLADSICSKLLST